MMSMVKKGFAAMCLVMVLAGGTASAGNSVPGAERAQATRVSNVQEAPALAEQSLSAPEAPAVPAPSNRRFASPALRITGLAYDVADEGEARVNVTATGILQNSSKGSLNLRDARVMLRDAEGKISIPATIEVVAGSKESLGRGEEAQVRLTFDGVPTDARDLRLSLDTPAGGTVVNAITVTIACTWSPLRCTITIGFSQ